MLRMGRQDILLHRRGQLGEGEGLAEHRHVAAQRGFELLAFGIAGDEDDRQARDGARARPGRPRRRSFPASHNRAGRDRAARPEAPPAPRAPDAAETTVQPRPSSDSARKARTSSSSSTTRIRAPAADPGEAAGGASGLARRRDGAASGWAEGCRPTSLRRPRCRCAGSRPPAGRSRRPGRGRGRCPCRAAWSRRRARRPGRARPAACPGRCRRR